MRGLPYPRPSDGVGVEPLIGQLINLARMLKALESQSHLVHLNYVGTGNFLAVHEFLKGQYEAHLEQFDTTAEFVRALGVPFVATVKELHAPPEGFKDLVADCGCEGMLQTYWANLQATIAMAQQLEPLAQKARAIDVANWCAEVVGASSKACWFLRATLGIR